MDSSAYKIGLMFSTSGPYAMVSRSMLNGTLLALSEGLIENSLQRIEPVIVNPEGDLTRYRELARELLGTGIRHIIGCYTSLSRKEVIPIFEKHDALLWYPSHYEGFESSNNVIYTGASPNQHVLPLVRHMAREGRTKAFCVGSNYIWAWESSRVLREALEANAGHVVGERYAPVGDRDFGSLCEAIIDARPDFVFSNFIGTSECAFLQQFRAACRNRGIDQIKALPITSCTLSESDLQGCEASWSNGHISSSVYFSSIGTPGNKAFVEAYRKRFPDDPPASADAEASYIAAKLLMHSLAIAASDTVNDIKDAVVQQLLAAPQGTVRIDSETYHAWLTPRIGRSTASGEFEILYEEPSPVRPDPYLVHSAPQFAELSTTNLRVVGQ